MATDCFLFQVIHVDNPGRRRLTQRNLRRNLETHHDNLHRLARTVRQRMADSRGQVREIIGSHAKNLIGVKQSGAAPHREVKFLFAVIKSTPAGSVRINRDFAETRDTAQNFSVGVALTKDWMVMATFRRKSDIRLIQFWKIAMEPGGIDLAILRPEIAGNQQNKPKNF